MTWIEKIKLLPVGYCEVRYEGKKYAVTREDFNGGKSIKVFAKETGGNDFISFNYYLTSTADLLKPCEMPEVKVIRFLENYVRPF